jgi:hypothetical protein
MFKSYDESVFHICKMISQLHESVQVSLRLSSHSIICIKTAYSKDHVATCAISQMLPYLGI